MAIVEVHAGGVRRRREPASLRWRVALTLAFVVAAAFIAGAAFLYEEAVEDRHAIEHRAMVEAVSGSSAFDREIAATGFLLQGLSRSPALKSRDLRAFYNQMAETPRPEGSWFVLWDMNGQVLNTIRPFGTRLPTRAEIGGTGDGYDRVRDRGLSISNRTMAPVARVPTIAVHLRLDGADGEMWGMLSMALPEKRLNAVVREHPLPAGWTTTVLDRNLVPIATSEATSSAVSPALIGSLRDLPASGHFTVDSGVEDVLVGVQRSVATGYTTITTVPFAVANAPVTDAVQKISVVGALLLLAGGVAGLVIMRQLGPVEATAAHTARQLRLAEARYASLWNDAPESLFVVTVTEDGRFVFEGLNPAHARATGLSFEDVAGKAPEECLPPDSAAAVTARYRACLKSGEPMVYDEVLDFPSGRRHWQTSLAPVRDPETGRIVVLVGTARDVTADRTVTAQIERSRLLLQTTMDALSAHIAILDEKGTIIAVNQAWHRFADEGAFATPDHGVGTSYVETCRAAAASDPQAALVAQRLDAVLAGRQQEFRLSYRCGDRFFQMTAARFTHEGAAHVVVAHEDVTELTSARQDVRDIAGRLLSLQEDERQRIAADLHDSTAQHIVAAGLGLMHVDAMADSPDAVRSALGPVRSALDEAHKEIRTLSYLLYPPNLRTNGLASSLRHFVTGFSQRTTLEGKVRVTGDVDAIPLDLQRAVLRVVQEALVNVHRHAEATKVSVTLRRDGKGLHLRIADNGKGLLGRDGASAAPISLGVGIPGMEARIRQFTGTMDITSGPRGTTVRASVPLPGQAEREQMLDLGPEHSRIELPRSSATNLRVSPDGHGENSG